MVPRTSENNMLCPIEWVSTYISLAIKPLKCNEYSIDSRKSVLAMWWTNYFSLHALEYIWLWFKLWEMLSNKYDNTGKWRTQESGKVCKSYEDSIRRNHLIDYHTFMKSRLIKRKSLWVLRQEFPLWYYPLKEQGQLVFFSLLHTYKGETEEGGKFVLREWH